MFSGDSKEAQNAIFTIQSIFRENLPQGVMHLRSAGDKATTLSARKRLYSAADQIEAIAKRVQQ
jgi:hypothetical protein